MKAVEFSTSLLFFWVKGKVEVDSRFVKTNLSNTLLGFIPAGKDQQSIPLKNISGAMLSTKYFIKPIILGLLIFFIGLSSFSDSFLFGLILLILGIGIAGSGIQTILNIEKSGMPYLISVPFFEKQKMELLNHTIHEALAEDTDKTDLNLFFDKKSQ
ncbi:MULTISPECIES: hypothetical protein [Bacillus cereus group]|uniref:Uncharacterized protein n=1 Tax=Bacillus cytotoxicus TaxID=580165 RepID=A0AAX2CNF9_9BACI|nr:MULTISPECIES: hypothetical protein [Bacillus cereus group]AWC30719.1 hypothetical protein CG483_021845 [Bacillus cytotoxicus]AWC42861.1 hypothetical protein CG480_021865 [Bacillus cytotoxicus]AWC50792.1 hypothetical protein CG478_021865 [Bacillus cytotoxicus]AWC54847.1 hypothetical protein CG477_022050 [Bacillus cytotoxicus]AWC58969.1 hypothetical protein CG476_022070 [Bacillus cytotoxicus]